MPDSYLMENSFETYRATLQRTLPYVEDDTFSWNNVVGLLIIKLTNTDSLNKDRDVSHATQIQLTAESTAIDGARKTEDFFPTLTLNSSFKSWRISIPARINYENIRLLSDAEGEATTGWKDDSIQIRRRLLNPDNSGNGNPALQICYGNDLMPLREKLKVNDYLVVTKLKQSTVYPVFGVRSDVDLGSGKQMYLASTAGSDNTVFNMHELSQVDAYDAGPVVGENILLYGVPGAGKSYTIQQEYVSDERYMERLVFHPDYTYSDFVGQILPTSKSGHVEYKFTEGPFTRLLKRAVEDEDHEYFLIIEEINRGNAPAIFGDIFQLLDRVEASEPEKGILAGESQYGITNADIAEKVYGDPDRLVKIPANMTILATMNTADQNVFTLDTAFQRRWHMRMIENSFDNHRFGGQNILDTSVTWERFCLAINEEIIHKSAGMTSSEDKRLGAYFVSQDDLIYQDDSAEGMTADQKKRARRHNRQFAEKVIKYLWDDAFKYSRGDIFEVSNYSSLEAIVKQFMEKTGDERLLIFKEEIRNAFAKVAE